MLSLKTFDPTPSLALRLPMTADTGQPSELLGNFVGVLAAYDIKNKNTSSPIFLHSHQEVYVGRDQTRCQYYIEEPLVSKRHLRIYTIIFDEENTKQVPPLVYAQDLSLNGTDWNGHSMGGGKGSFLLSDGDILRLTPNVSLIYTCTDLSIPRFDTLQQVEMRVFEHEYAVTTRKLGSGAFGVVHMAFNRDTGRQLACKITNLRAFKDQVLAGAEGENHRLSRRYRDATRKEIADKLQKKLEVYYREAKILETLEHPNIINVERVIKSSNTVYIFQELLAGGDLFSYIQYRGGKLLDIEAAVIVRQILMALEYLHDRNIVHRDLKPDNILLASRAEGCRVVLTDFGCATVLRPNVERMSTMVGTFEFSAPEVLRTTPRGYTKAIDMWSLGSVTAVLLTGDPPFEALRESRFTMECARVQGIRKLEASMELNKIGDRARDFTLRLHEFNEIARMDVKQALEHSWFTNRSHKDEFEALYKRSIRGWKPLTLRKPIVVDLHSYFEAQSNTPNPTPSQQADSDSSSDGSYVCENYPQDEDLETSSMAPLDSLPLTIDEEMDDETPRALSETLSDLWLPPHGNFDDQETVIRPTFAAGDSMRRTSMTTVGDFDYVQTRGVSGGEAFQTTVDDFDGEVYEVVSNEITGKEQYQAYGASSNLL